MKPKRAGLKWTLMGDKVQAPFDWPRNASRGTGATAWVTVALVIALWPSLDTRLPAEPALRIRMWVDPLADPWLPGMRDDPNPADAGDGRTLLGQFECGGCHHIDGMGGTRGLALRPGVPRADVAGQWPDTEAMRLRWIVPQAAPATPMRSASTTPRDAIDVGWRYLRP